MFFIVPIVITAGLVLFGATCYTGAVPEKQKEPKLIKWVRENKGLAMGLSGMATFAGLILGALSSGAW